MGRLAEPRGGVDIPSLRHRQTRPGPLIRTELAEATSEEETASRGRTASARGNADRGGPVTDSSRSRGNGSMCTQVDKRWACGHVGYFQIKWCERIFKGCKGTSAQHEIIDEPEECGDCKRRYTLPKPFTAK
ncbi:hypothetical protein CDD83_10825 [Cordyceps sp. RAO-2017]|nr:hypothetical protein CDD83_10825 [Cordyceps sp. RAO-2017]